MSHIQKRARNGRTTYLARWRTADGQEHRKSFTRKTDAGRFLVEIEDAKLRGAYVDPSAGRLDLRTQAERWFASTAALAPSTRRDYRNLLDNQVLPRFGDWPLAGIDTLAVREWKAAMVAGGLGGKRAGKALQVLRQVLASAVEGGRLARNAAAGVKPPKVQRKEMHFLDAAEVEALAAAIAPPYGVLVRFAAYTGLRPEELVALRVGRLDLLRGTARVCEAATEVGGRLCWGDVKSHEARTVKLPRFLREQVGAYLDGRPHEQGDLVFGAPQGGPLRENNFMARRFRPAARAVGLPADLRMYDLRHTAASLHIAEGGSVKAVQSQLGHKSAAMTLDRYGHLFPDETDRLAERMDALYARAVAPPARPSGAPEVVQLRESAGQ